MTQTKDQSFRVISENMPCGSTGVTCAKNVYIYYNNLTVTLMRGRHIEVNQIFLENLDQGPQVFGGVNIMETASTYFVVNSTDFLIKWDGATRLYIVIHPKWKSQMEGVCGNYDSDTNNDMVSAGGILQTEVTEFVKSWQLSQACNPSSPLIDENDPCQGRKEREPWAKTSCEVIRTVEDGNPFNPCIEKVAVTDINR